MAIVQISRITQRKGLQIDLPDPLAGAEFGWSVDTQQLYIGNGTLEEGAPIVGNTEILTEHSDIFNIVPAYTYTGFGATGYTAQTGETPGSPVKVTLQNWLDQWASVLDFGAVGDGVTDDTDAINRALYQIYCVQVNPQIRRSIFFPAGVYKVTGTINIPPYATLYGEGPDNSIIQLTSDATVSYVIRTADSAQNTGYAIGDAGATPPTSITVSNLCFQSLKTSSNIALIEDATNCTFTNTRFVGALTASALSITTYDNGTAYSTGDVVSYGTLVYQAIQSTTGNLPTDSGYWQIYAVSCINFASTPSLVTSQIQFDNCDFGGTLYAVNTDQQFSGVSVTKSKFDTLYQGIVLGNGGQVNPSYPLTGFRVSNSFFNNIYAQGIIVNESELNVSAYNIFYNVGNNFSLSPYTAYTSVISFISSNNVSVGDMFQRTSAGASVYPRIDLNGTSSIAFTNSEQLALGGYVRKSGVTVFLTANQPTPTTIFTIPTQTTNSFTINYSINRSTHQRTGTISVTTNFAGTLLTYSDDYVETDSTGIALSISQSGSLVSLQYTSDPAGGTGAGFTYSINYLV